MPAKRSTNRTTTKPSRRTTAPRSKTPPQPISFKSLDDLPRDLRTAVDNAIVHRPEGCTDIDAIHKHFRLSEHDITRATFRRYTRLVTWRVRLGRIGEIVHHFVGHIPPEQEDRWFRTAHLMLVASLIEALDKARHRLSVADLTKLAKAYSDYRTASRPDPDTCPAESKRNPAGGGAALPERFADTVRTIYGVTLDARP